MTLSSKLKPYLFKRCGMWICKIRPYSSVWHSGETAKEAYDNCMFWAEGVTK